MSGGDAAQTSLLPAHAWTGVESWQHRRQTFCGDREGWGPISEIRYDLTPCFLDVNVLFAASWGVLLGFGALWFLVKKRVPQEVGKNWHFYAKL